MELLFDAGCTFLKLIVAAVALGMELLLDAGCTFSKQIVAAVALCMELLWCTCLKQIVAAVGDIVKKHEQPNIIDDNSRVGSRARSRYTGHCDYCGGYGPLGEYCEDCEDTNMIYDQ